MERLVSEPHTRLRYFCSPQHTDSAHYPVIGQMERAAGFVYDDTPQTEARQARRGAGRHLDPDGRRGPFAEMLSLPNDATSSGARSGTTTAKAENAGSAHRAGGGIVAAKPLADDLRGYAHGTDPTSLETFGRVVDRVCSLPVLLDRDVPSRFSSGPNLDGHT